MQHPDEGTVHAWLDGELPGDEAARIEAHVAACASCAALVAEARGLIAASSRILGALDDVPGGVVPDATSPAGDPAVARPGLTIERGATAAPAARTSRRPFYRNPQLAAAAAVVLMAVGTWTVWQRSTAARDAVAPPGLVGETAASAAPAVQRMDSAALRGATVPAPSSDPRAAKAMADEASSGKRATARAAGAPSNLGRSTQVAGAPAREKAPAAPAEAASGARLLAERDQSARRDRAANEAPPPAAPAPAPALAQRATKDSALKGVATTGVTAERKVAVSTDSLVAKEEARVRGEVAAQRQLPDSIRARRKLGGDTPARLSEVVVTGAAAALPGAAAGASIAIVNACYELTRTTAALENRVPARIHLLGTRGPTIGQRVLNELTVLDADPDTGEWFWWVRGDRVAMLVRVEDNVVRYEAPFMGAGAVDVKATMRPCREG